VVDDVPDWFSDKSMGDVYNNVYWKAYGPAAKNKEKIENKASTPTGNSAAPLLLSENTAEEALHCVLIVLYSITYGRDNGFTEEEITEYLENKSWEQLANQGLDMAHMLYKEIMEKRD